MGEIVGAENATRSCKCNHCKKTIDAGKRRAIYKSNWHGSPRTSFLCISCGKKVIRKHISNLTKVLKELK